MASNLALTLYTHTPNQVACNALADHYSHSQADCPLDSHLHYHNRGSDCPLDNHLHYHIQDSGYLLDNRHCTRSQDSSCPVVDRHIRRSTDLLTDNLAVAAALHLIELQIRANELWWGLQIAGRSLNPLIPIPGTPWIVANTFLYSSRKCAKICASQWYM